MTGPAEPSPDQLGETTTRAGGRRLNRLPLILALVIGAVVIGAIAYTYQLRGAGPERTAADGPAQRPEAASAIALFGNAPASGEIARRTPPAPSMNGTGTGPATALPTDGESHAPHDPQAEALRRRWQAHESEQTRLEQQRQQELQAALSAPTTVTAGGDRSRPSLPPAAGVLVAPAPGGSFGSFGSMGAGGPGGLMGSDADPNRQAAKAAWISSPPTNPSNVLAHRREAALSPYEVKAGTIIPGVMISGIHSDLPGMIIAQVRENVYDSATGRHLLIPQAARLIGTYDNGVSMGQSRVLVGWNRIIYPDGSSLDLGKMPGADAGGQAGFEDRVNNHYWKVFGNALLLSIFSAGIQLSQPQAQSGENYHSQQIIAGALGQQFGELGSEMARRGLSIAPTLEIRPGFTFNVMVTQDIVLQPWQD
jgi:type IV secretory pathway VirB10-like protein